LREELLEAGLPPEVPAVIVSRATAPDQRHQYTTIGKLDVLPRLEPPSILLLGWTLAATGSKSLAGDASRAFDYAELILARE